MLHKVLAVRMPKIRPVPFLMFGAVMLVAVSWAATRPAEAARFQNRGMYINSARAGDTTFYEISLRYTTPSNIGSLRMEFCDDPIPAHPCAAPPGLDVSNATLASQSGETGFTIATQTDNLLILSRTPSLTGNAQSTYRLEGVRNPDGEMQNFYVRLTSHTSTDGSGSFVDFGSVSAQLTPEIEIFTQVPPILIFCVAYVIHDDECRDTEGNYVDFGELEPTETYYTQSEILARTNASYGLAISVTGRTMTSGVRFIPALETPTESFVGTGQFGINLATNTTPNVGSDPVGPGINTVVNPNYATPNYFLFNEGDILVTSSGVTRTRKFTASYIVNVPADQAPGLYSTTLTYVCIAGF